MLRTRHEITPAILVGKHHGYSQQQIDWLKANPPPRYDRAKAGKWVTPWNDTEPTYFMNTRALAEYTGLQQTQVIRELGRRPLEPDALLGHHVGYKVKTAQKWASNLSKVSSSK